jgi:WD40 repeat protein
MFDHRLLIVAALLVLATVPGSAAPSEPAKPGPATTANERQRLDRYGDPLPAGAVARLGTVRYRLDGNGILPDGETVVSATGTSIQLWDARTGSLKREIETGLYAITSGFSLSRDGRSLAITGLMSNSTGVGWQVAVQAFDLVSGKVVGTLKRETGGVRDIAVAPDGKMLMILDGDGKLAIHELPSGIVLLSHRMKGAEDGHLALSPDGTTLAVTGGDNNPKIAVWHWQTAEEPRVFRVGGYGTIKVAFSQDGKLLATCDEEEPTVSVLNVQSGRILYKLELPGAKYYSRDVAFSPDGKTLVASGRDGANRHRAVFFWDIDSGKYLRHLDVLPGWSALPLAFSPDGRLLVCGRQVWDLARNVEFSANEQAHRGTPWRIVTGAKNLAVSASDDNTIRVWDVASGSQLQCFHHEGWVRDIAISHDGTKLASNSMDDSVCLWDLSLGKRIYKLPGHGQFGGKRAVAFAPDGKSFFSWGDDMDLRKWDVRTGKAIAEHPIRPEGVRVVTDDDDPMERDRNMMEGAIAGVLAPNASRLIVETSAKLYLFDTATGKEVRQLPMAAAAPNTQSISPDGSALLASVQGKSIVSKLHNGMIQTSSPKSHLVCEWDLASGKQLKEIHVPEEGAGPVAFASDGQSFAAASFRPGDHIRVWNASGQQQWEARGFGGNVRSLAFMPDGKRLISGMDDGSVLVWDLTQRP